MSLDFHCFLVEPRNEALIRNTLEQMERMIAVNNVRCVQFRPKIPSDRYYITIIDGPGCYAFVSKLDMCAASNVATGF